MKALTTIFIFVTVLVFAEQNELGNKTNIVLPGSGLMKCTADQLWQDAKPDPRNTYPVQVRLDHFDQNGCPQGIMALYDNAVPFAQIKAALDQRYGKWGRDDKGKIKLWRVEPEKFAIQLAMVDDVKGSEFENEKGLKQVIYLSFGAK